MKEPVLKTIIQTWMPTGEAIVFTVLNARRKDIEQFIRNAQKAGSRAIILDIDPMGQQKRLIKSESVFLPIDGPPLFICDIIDEEATENQGKSRLVLQ